MVGRLVGSGVLYRVGTVLLRLLLLGNLFLTAACMREETSVQGQRGDLLTVSPATPSKTDAISAMRVPDLDTSNSAVAISSVLLSHRRDRRILPEDPMIGPLSDRLKASPEEREILHAAGRLLAAVLDGDMTGAPFSEQRRLHVASAIEHHLRRGLALSGFRFGVVELTGNTAFLRARLSSPLGSIPADLYLIRLGGRWLVDDLQTDWAALQRAQPKSEQIPLARTNGWVYF